VHSHTTSNMSEEKKGAAPAAEGGGGGFGGGFGGPRRGGRRGDRRGRRGRRGRGDAEKQPWIPVTKLGRLVKGGRIKKIEDIFLASLPIKEYQIVEQFLPDLKDEVLKICPVQKQTTAGQRTRFKACVVVGDYNGHIGLGHKCSKEVAGAIRGALIDAKLNIYPVRRGWWGGRFGLPHTVPCKVTGKCGSVRFRVIPAPRGTGLVAARAPKKLLNYAGYKDVYTNAKGNTKTLGNFVKAAFHAICATNSYLTPDHWGVTVFDKSPYQEHSDWLKDNPKESFQKKAAREFGRDGQQRGPRRDFRGGPPRERGAPGAQGAAAGAPGAEAGAGAAPAETGGAGEAQPAETSAE
jgi:small subunit ribosomal protein S2e